MMTIIVNAYGDKMRKKTRAHNPSKGLAPASAYQLYREDAAFIEKLAIKRRGAKGAIVRELVARAIRANFHNETPLEMGA